MIKRAIVSLLASIVLGKETFSEELTIVPLPKDYNLLNFDFKWEIEKKKSSSFNVVDTFPEPIR